MNFFLIALVFSLGINLVMFVPAFIQKTDKLTDISYAVSFAAVAVGLFALSNKQPLHIFLLVCVLLWSLRLGIYLFSRILWMKRDKRFDGMRENFWRFLKFWMLQGVTVFIVIIAATAVWSRETAPIVTLTYVGLSVFIIGLWLETVADYQKFNFIKNPKNKDKWIENGVWKMSRHPNYLGEIMVWSGIWIMAVDIISSPLLFAVTLASPVYIILLLLFVSGVPLLEKSADKKWGQDHEYKEYKKSTPVLVPSLRSIIRAIKT